MRYSCLITTENLDPIIVGLQANDCIVERDNEAGTVTVRDGDVNVLRAIQKGHKGPWIALFRDSDRIKWQSRLPRCDTCNQPLPPDAAGKTCVRCLAVIITHTVPEPDEAESQ